MTVQGIGWSLVTNNFFYLHRLQYELLRSSLKIQISIILMFLLNKKKVLGSNNYLRPNLIKWVGYSYFISIRLPIISYRGQSRKRYQSSVRQELVHSSRSFHRVRSLSLPNHRKNHSRVCSEAISHNGTTLVFISKSQHEPLSPRRLVFLLDLVAAVGDKITNSDTKRLSVSVNTFYSNSNLFGGRWLFGMKKFFLFFFFKEPTRRANDRCC